LELKKPPAPEAVDEVTVLLKEVVEFEGFVGISDLSSSMSLSLLKILLS
jgi:hypothetical protein